MGFSPRAPISATAKCAQLLVSIKQKRPEDQDVEGFQKVLHFGSVAVGCTAERQIDLTPHSMCRAVRTPTQGPGQGDTNGAPTSWCLAKVVSGG